MSKSGVGAAAGGVVGIGGASAADCWNQEFYSAYEDQCARLLFGAVGNNKTLSAILFMGIMTGFGMLVTNLPSIIRSIHEQITEWLSKAP